MTNGLGRGLSSLIPSRPAAGSGIIKKIDISSARSGKDEILQIETSRIKLNPHQPRQKFADQNMEELCESIREYGIIQPLIVSRENGVYGLIAGERRLRAAKTIGLAVVPAILRDANEQQKLEVALIENIQRENLNAIELASAFQMLIDEFNLTQDKVAKRVGKSRPSVTNTLRLLSLPEEIKLALIDGRITEGHAKYLVGLDSEAKQMSLFRKILHSSLSVHDTNKAARHMGGTKAARIKINYGDKDKEFALRQFFGAKVEIARKGKGGQIIIDFYSDEELNEIIKKLK